MSIELPDDDDFNAWLRDVDDDEVDVNPVLPPKLQAEHDRLFNARVGSAPGRRRLAPDLQQLEDEIGNAELRQLFNPQAAPYMFDRFEAITTMRGGMGLVIKARDPQLDRHVAIKLWMRSGPEAQQDLIAEAKTLAKLEHPNVVTVYETGVWNERVYFVMEWIEGTDGHAWMERQRSWRDVRRVFVAAGIGLAAAHEAGIHHRDFKPANMLIGKNGRVVVADFGLAASLHPSGRDESGGVTGTPVYMAPERLRGKRGDARSDQFSFCVAVWRAMFGLRPFPGETGGELSAAIERGEIREPPDTDVPAWLVAVVRKGLAYDANERHRDMKALVAALRDEPADAAAIDGAADDGARVRWDRWPYLVIGFLSALVAVLGANAATRTPEPVAAAVEVDPYHAILGAIVADDFGEADRLWRAYQLELSDAQMLRIGRDSLERAKRIAPFDRAKAEEAVFLTDNVTRVLAEIGRTPTAKEAGSQLATERKAWLADHPL